MRNGVRKIFEMGYRRLVMEDDNMIVIYILRREISNLWVSSNFIKDTGKFLSYYSNVNVSYIFRDTKERQTES